MVEISKLNDVTQLSILNGDVTFDVEPLTTASFSTCETKAKKRIDCLDDVINNAKALKASVQMVGFDITDPDQRSGALTLFFIQELARRHIKAWHGVTLNGEPAALNDENIDAVMGHYLIGKLFYNELTFNMAARIRAKKDSGTDADGISDKVPNTVKDATN